MHMLLTTKVELISAVTEHTSMELTVQRQGPTCSYRGNCRYFSGSWTVHSKKNVNEQGGEAGGWKWSLRSCNGMFVADECIWSGS